ncbi:MAG: helix-turn-helix domain-containing protein [Chloroflexaceae bacterium]|nr:helix-turn-helix domain-containing protein [Chloroflexaceae bacterium]
MKKSDKAAYLSLSEACELLGVHATTLRRWADAGAIPVYITPGGHRRFARSDIYALADHQPLTVQALARTWASRALAQTRTELKQVEQTSDWLAQLDDQDRANWRKVSMQLMGVVLRYISKPDDDETLLEEARAIGTNYAHQAQSYGMSLTTALEAALFFRDTLIDAAMALPDHVKLETEANARLLRRISRVLNVVHLAVAAGYERYHQTSTAQGL